MVTDRYMPVVELIFDTLHDLPYDPNDANNHPLRTKLHEILRKQGKTAVLRSHCDLHGHIPATFIRALNSAGYPVVHRIGCEYCGTELKEVEE